MFFDFKDLWVVKSTAVDPALEQTETVFLDYDEAVKRAVELNESKYILYENHDSPKPKQYLHIVIPFLDFLNDLIEIKSDKAYDEGRSDSAEASYDSGYECGYNEAYNAGFEAGYKEGKSGD